MACMKIELPEFHPAQVEIASHPARFKAVSCGRRFGKGIMGVVLCALAALTAFQVPPKHGRAWWICPSFASASFTSAWREAKNIADQVPGCEINIQKKHVSFPNRGWFEFKSAEEPESLRGEGLDLVVIDEAAHIKNLEEIWEQCLRPTLSDRQGKALFISTPKGFNYFWKLFKREETESDWKSFRFPSTARPTFAMSEYEAAKRTLPALVHRQEYDAEFCQLAGAMFKREYFPIIPTAPNVGRWVRSWDLAYSTKTVADYTAGVKCGLTADGTFVIGHLVHGRWETGSSRVVHNTALSDGFAILQGIEVVGAQLGTFQSLQADPMLANIPIISVPVDRDKITRAMPLLARGEQGKIALVQGPWNQAFIDEFCAFPDGEHDDIVDATSGGLSLIAAPVNAVTSAKDFMAPPKGVLGGRPLIS